MKLTAEFTRNALYIFITAKNVQIFMLIDTFHFPIFFKFNVEELRAVPLTLLYRMVLVCCLDQGWNS